MAARFSGTLPPSVRHLFTVLGLHPVCSVRDVPGLYPHQRATPHPPRFLKSVDFKGTLSCFRINTYGSVDSKGAYIAQNLCRSRPFSGRGANVYNLEERAALKKKSGKGFPQSERSFIHR